MHPSSTRGSERQDLETETYHYLGWSQSRIESTVARLIGGEHPDEAVTRGAAREVVAAFGLAGPPEHFWPTGLGRRCIDAGFGPRT
ncbi:MAG: hypothetical protein QOF28_1925 [Actinomycetota bacterium]|nr:hypothetical protein [Actinomycetota bacterium]